MAAFNISNKILVSGPFEWQLKVRFNDLRVIEEKIKPTQIDSLVRDIIIENAYDFGDSALKLVWSGHEHTYRSSAKKHWANESK